MTQTQAPDDIGTIEEGPLRRGGGARLRWLKDRDRAATAQLVGR